MNDEERVATPLSPTKRSLSFPLIFWVLIPLVLPLLTLFFVVHANFTEAEAGRSYLLEVVAAAAIGSVLVALAVGVQLARGLERLARVSSDAFVHRDGTLLEGAASPVHEIDLLRSRMLSTFGQLELTLGDLEQKISHQEDVIATRSGELIAADGKLDRLAAIDGLTGLANYREFDRIFTESLRTAVRQRAKLALLMVDLDHFKSFNELYGHDAGNDCLKSVASVLSAFSRRPLDVVARYGGEEFVLVLYDPRDDALDVIGEKLRSGVAALEITSAGSPFGVLTISIGGAVAPLSPDRDFDAMRSILLSAADAALHRAKLVRNEVVIAQV